MASRLEAFFLREWQRPSLWQIFLRPWSWLFAALVALRRLCFRAGLMQTHRLPKPILVVGNLTVGGTGKTPLVLALARRLQDSGRPVGIVTRGYAKDAADRANAGREVTHIEGGNAEGFSDEATLLATRSGAPVYAGRDRVQVATTMLRQQPQVEIVLSDDGLQHYALGRDIEIAVVDVTRGFGNGAYLPAGPMRESPSRLSQVDCVVLNCTSAPELDADAVNTGEAANSAERMMRMVEGFGKPVFEMRYGRERFFPLNAIDSMGDDDALIGLAPSVLLQQLRGKRVVALAGIGNPDRFFAQLKRLGVVLADQLRFPDHHAFTPDDIAKLDADFVLMTEKDAVKCRHFADPRSWMMRVDAELPDAFYEYVLTKIDHVARSKTS